MPPRALRTVAKVWAHALVPDANPEAAPKKPRRPVLPKKPQAAAADDGDDDEQPAPPIKARRQDGDDDLFEYLFSEEADEDSLDADDDE